MTTVPKLWPESTVICIASGPSLTDADVEACRGSRVIVVNDNYRKAPWADVLYAADKEWWLEHHGVPSFQGLKYAVAEKHPTRPAWPNGVQVLRNTGEVGLESDPTGLRTGWNSGYQAINLAVHLGAKRILLLGYDMQRGPDGRTHWFGHHCLDNLRRESLYVDFLKRFPTLVNPLQAIGVDVINCSRATALRCFPQMPIEQGIRTAVAA